MFCCMTAPKSLSRKRKKARDNPGFQTVGKPLAGFPDKLWQPAVRRNSPDGEISTLAACMVCSARYTPWRNMQ